MQDELKAAGITDEPDGNSDKNNNIKSGIKLNKRLKKFLLNETIYFSLIIASEVITFIKYN